MVKFTDISINTNNGDNDDIKKTLTDNLTKCQAETLEAKRNLEIAIEEERKAEDEMRKSFNAESDIRSELVINCMNDSDEKSKHFINILKCEDEVNLLENTVNDKRSEEEVYKTLLRDHQETTEELKIRISLIEQHLKELDTHLGR